MSKTKKEEIDIAIDQTEPTTIEVQRNDAYESDTRLRILYLYQLLLSQSDEDHPLSTKQITDKMEELHSIHMHRTTVSSDIALLKAAGFEIMAERKRAWEYYLADRAFSIPELKLLIDAVQSSKFITEKKSKALMEKLVALTSETNANKLQRSIHITGRAKSDNEKGYYIVDAINDVEVPYLSVKRAWHTEHNRPVILDELKTKAAYRDVPLPDCLTECLREAKANSKSEFVIANRDGGPLTYTQFVRVWKYITTRSTKERTYVRYVNGQRIKHTVTPVLGEKAAHNNTVVYTMDFQVTPHQLRHTYITNLIYAMVDPKTVQYLAGHQNSKITMDIYAKVKYNRPRELAAVVNSAFKRTSSNN